MTEATEAYAFEGRTMLDRDVPLRGAQPAGEDVRVPLAQAHDLSAGTERRETDGDARA